MAAGEVEHVKTERFLCEIDLRMCLDAGFALPLSIKIAASELENVKTERFLSEIDL